VVFYSSHVAVRKKERNPQPGHPSRGEGFIERLLLEQVFEGLASVRIARRSRRGRGTRSRRLGVGRWRGIFLDGHAKFVEGAGVLGILGRNAFGDWLGAFKLRAGIEKAALFTAVQFGLALGTSPVGIESRSEDGAAIGTARARDGADHARRARAELVGAAGPARRRLAFVGLVLFILLFRVAVTAVTVLSIHKCLRPPVSTDCHNYNSCFRAVALANLACIQSDCYTRPDRALIHERLLAELRTADERETGPLCL